MTRAPRKTSEAGLYHIVARGNGKQIIFEDDADRLAFLETLHARAAEAEIDVIAWCLMDNHVHLCMSVDPEDGLDALSKVMQAVQTSHAKRFNARSGHVGHVFQARFASMPIDGERYLLEAVRYIHNNPAKAGICAAGDYPWSSYHEYAGEDLVGVPAICSTELVLGALGGAEGFIEFSNAAPTVPYRFISRARVPDSELIGVAAEVLGGIDPKSLKSLPRKTRNRYLGDLRATGMTVSQIVRLTGIGEWAVTQATKNLASVPVTDARSGDPAARR